MDCLSPSTLSRLQRLPQHPEVVWEGDRLALNAEVLNPERPTVPLRADCFVWIDGAQQQVRGIDAVTQDQGPTAFVESLFRAMESPLSWPDEPSLPLRPGRVVVRDRELHFLLRGLLQPLDITVEYQPELPLVDQLLPGLQTLMGLADNLSDQLSDLLLEKARQVWELAPWRWLLDSHILSIEMKAFGLTSPLYVSILGGLGLEQGLLLYRSLDSLTAFRAAVSHLVLDRADLQAAFSQQDCLFLNYEPRQVTPFVRRPRLVKPLRWEDLELDFGSINPEEGMRSRLDLTELSTLYASLEGILRFMDKHSPKFEQGDFPACRSRFKIKIPDTLLPDQGMAPVIVTVKTQPVLARAFLPC
ncbi:MAG: hypothetical protein HC824_02190 [Synechococcales cyanobacterium RM1_1_8]|nr:hypothetical protein [Synechococcales cyanobacterium RM1_1_8]